MGKGLDTTGNCSSKAAAIHEAGFGFVGRYYFDIVSRVKTKLTKQEAQALTAAGLYIVAVWENSSDHVGYFSYAKGVSDGRAAFRYAADVIGQPKNAPIYFAVDYDATATDLASVVGRYFQGIKDAFESESHGGEAYPVGVYGSGLTCATLLQASTATYCWLAQSTGWRGSRSFTEWNLKQGPTTKVLGIEIDTNESQGRGGGFQVR